MKKHGILIKVEGCLMNIVDIINKKRKKEILTKEEIDFVIKNYVAKEIPDYQMSALLMAITLNGMTEEETVYLTSAMLHSGKTMNLSSIPGIKVDKHSTGGVGDKTTLILAPIVAACGIPVAKMSGRGLGFTGGTIDKLESIPGFQTNLSFPEFIKNIETIGISVASGNEQLVPADKMMYALRDVTGTVESIPLIASSIMSKKLASGADAFVIDVKVGNGALMKTKEDAETLAKLMIHIGKKHQKKVVCILTNMDEPLGCAIGNSLEVEESLNVLKGNGPKDITELVIYLAIHMVRLGKNISFNEAKKEVQQVLTSGQAVQKFEEFIRMQKGDLSKIEISKNVISIKSKTSGVISKIDTEKLGEIARKLGAGRYQKDDVIDSTVGLKIFKKVGEFVVEAEELVQVFVGQKDISIEEILSCFTIQEHFVEPNPLVLETFSDL